MEILGHTRMSTTMDIYAHVLSALRNEVASRMDEALGGVQTEQPGRPGSPKANRHSAR
jgi:hypothetical protein